jgi:ligand-binding sensor domain-containing protein
MTLYETASGELWVGTYADGLFEFDRNRGEFVAHYRHDPGDPQSLAHDLVLTAYEDRAGALWIGTGGGPEPVRPRDETVHQLHREA